MQTNKRYQKYFTEADKYETIYTDATNLLADLKNDEENKNTFLHLLRQTEKKMKEFMQKHKYIEESDVESFTDAIQEVGKDLMTKAPDVSQVYVVLASILSYKMKKSQKAPEQQPEAGGEEEQPGEQT